MQNFSSQSDIHGVDEENSRVAFRQGISLAHFWVHSNSTRKFPGQTDYQPQKSKTLK
jgi:hypothetical protein